MKLDIAGTNSDVFSIGLGEKKIEFKSLNGVFYFRNFGTGWQKASSESLRESLKLRSWSVGITISKDELFLHNGSLWYSDATLNTINFEIDCLNFIKVADISNFVKININEISSDIKINTSYSDNIYIYGESNLVSVNIILPDALTLHVGRKIYIYNYTTTTALRIYTNNNFTTYYNVNTNQIISLLLISNNNSSGEWVNLTSTGGNNGNAVTNSSNQISVTLDSNIYGQNPFAVGDIIYYNTSNYKWQKAYSSNDKLNMVGMVVSRNGNIILICFYGQVQLESPLQADGLNIIPGLTYYLTNNSNSSYIGKATLNPGVINKKIFIAISTSLIFILNLEDSERFNQTDVYTLNDGESVILNNNLYNYLINGFIKDDSRLINFSGQILSGYPTNASIETNSEYISNSDIGSRLCFFMSGNDLIMKNNLGSIKSIVIFKRKIG
jgi:hypothetical protein